MITETSVCKFHQVKPTGFYRNAYGPYDIERPTGPICYRDDLRIYREVRLMDNSGLPHIVTGWFGRWLIPVFLIFDTGGGLADG